MLFRASRAQVRRLHICTEEGQAAEEATPDVGFQEGMHHTVRVDPKVQEEDPRAQRESCVPLQNASVVPVVVTYYMRTVAGPSSPSPRINCSLFSSLHALGAASAVVPTDTALVAAATIRCIDVLHDLLVRATSPVAPDTPLEPTPREALNGIESTLPHVLRTAINTLDGADVHPSSAAGRWYAGHDDPAQNLPNNKTSALDLVLGRVATSLLVPAIRAIVPCTLARTEHILSSFSRGGEPADAADLLGIVGAALEVLSGPVHIALHDRVALEAVRALASLITDQQREGPPAQRIHRIARKDALHFLGDAALLSLHRTAPAAVPPGSAGEMLGLALEAALGELALTLSAREGKSGLDAVEEQRVLVVLERAWSVGRRVGNIGGDAGGEERVDASQGDVHGQGVDVTMTDVDGEDLEGNDQRRGSDNAPTANGS